MSVRELPSVALGHGNDQVSAAARGHSSVPARRAPIQYSFPTHPPARITGLPPSRHPGSPHTPPEPRQRGRPVCSNCCYVQHGARDGAARPGMLCRGSRRALPGSRSDTGVAYRSPAPTCPGPRCLRDTNAARPSRQPGAARPSLRPRRRGWGQGGDQGWGERLPRAGTNTAPESAALPSITLVVSAYFTQRRPSGPSPEAGVPRRPHQCCPSASPALPRGCSAKQVRAPSRGQRGLFASFGRQPEAPGVPAEGPNPPPFAGDLGQRCSCPLFLTLLSSRVSSRPLRSAMQTQSALSAGQAGELIATV